MTIQSTKSLSSQFKSCLKCYQLNFSTLKLHQQQQQHQQQQIRFTSNRSSSSSQYLQRQAGDRFVKARLSPSTSSSSSMETDTNSFVARSAFKLLHLQSKFRMIKRGMTIIDLGASPGSWIEAILVELNKSNQQQQHARSSKSSKGFGKIIGVDLLPLSQSVLNLPNVDFIQGDFLNPIVQAKIVGLLRKDGNGNEDKVDLVLSDMLSNLTGNPFRDSQLSVDLCTAALQFALVHLKPSKEPIIVAGGPKKSIPPSLIMKCLQSSLADEFKKELLNHFKSVKVEKPPASRLESREIYFCCSSLRSVPLNSVKSKGQKVVEVVEEEEFFH